VSKLVDEDDDFLYLKGFVHGSGEYSDWELKEDGSQKYHESVHVAEHYSLYEIEVNYKINKMTGEVIYDSFRTT
jgi:hypothetical protein